MQCVSQYLSQAGHEYLLCPILEECIGHWMKSRERTGECWKRDLEMDQLPGAITDRTEVGHLRDHTTWSTSESLGSQMCHSGHAVTSALLNALYSHPS